MINFFIFNWRVKLFILITLMAFKVNAIDTIDEEIAVTVTKQDEKLTNAVYSVLVAEIAGQRGQLPLSVKYYLEAARLTLNPKIAERATRIAIFTGENESGLAAARIWFESQPNNNEAHQVLAVLLLRSGNIEAALTEFERLIAILRPRGAEEGYGLVAALLAREKNKEAALSIMNHLVMQAEKIYQPDALFALGHLYIRADQTNSAIETLDKVLRLRPEWNSAIILRARVLQIQGKNDAALNYLAGAVKNKPSDSSLRLAYGRTLINAKQFNQARAEFTTLARQEPQNSDIIFTLGILYLQNNQETQAKQQFLRLIKLKARVQEASFYLGQIEEAQNNLTNAINWYHNVKYGENAIDAQIKVAVLLARQGQLAKARSHLKSWDPKDNDQAVRLVLVESELLREAGRLEDGMEVLSRAIDELPDNADLLYARAMLAERLDKIAILEQDLKTILENDPNHVQALNALGYTLADRTKRLQEALGYIQRALALRPNEFYILDSMGWIQYRLGNRNEAVRYLQQALKSKPDTEVAAHLGEVLWVMGNRAEARKVWQRALKDDPESKIIREAMDKFNGR